jgi:thiol-disulfide isomerase/thioredoxin
VNDPSLNRRKMLTYLGLSAFSLGTTIACQSPQNRAASSSTALAQSPPAPSGPRLPEFQGINQWLNGGPLSVNDLKGSVVLIHIWTFGCINCQRTLPYVVQWHQKYANQGLKVVGIHSPEFAHERDINNVKQAIAKHNITYPNAIDNKFAMWKAYNNEYWPHLFLADRQGIIRYDHVGEGAYDTTEQTIQRLLG